jgi:hypothetical protein
MALMSLSHEPLSSALAKKFLVPLLLLCWVVKSFLRWFLMMPWQLLSSKVTSLSWILWSKCAEFLDYGFPRTGLCWLILCPQCRAHQKPSVR